MRSQKSSARMMGSQEPSVRIAPKYIESDGQKATKLLNVGGVKLDPWQSEILSDWLAFTPAGRFAAPTCGGCVPRQNGKSKLVQARAAAGMLLYNEIVVYTAHLQKTATETFEELRDYFEAPKLKGYVAEVKSALGREQIILKSGAKIKFLARTRSGGRGQHADLLIIDEAQEMDDTQQASFLPAISASLNPQTIYVGTPPGPEEVGEVFRRIRKNTLANETKTTAWFEFSVPEIGDVNDKSRWAATNPALGRRMLLSTIETEVENMAPDIFARERLGWWSPVAEKAEDPPALDVEKWSACASDELKPEGKTAYGIKFSADGTEVVLCGAVCPKGSPARVSLIDRKPTGHGTRWLAEWLCDHYGKASCVVIDGRNGVDVLVDKIADTWKAKNSIIRPTARDMVAAVGLMTNEVNEQTLTWYRPQEALNQSAITSTKRSIGGGWGFGGEDSAPIEAAALALWGCRKSKRDPGRKMRVG